MNQDIKNEAYDQLLSSLLSKCDTVQCVVREDSDEYFEAILDALVEKKYVTEWPFTKLGPGAAPILQYTFQYNYQTAAFMKERQQSLFSWLMPHPEDWSFWQGDTCMLATCTHERMVDFHPEIASMLEYK